MRSLLSACYDDHALKVSDSHCSAYPNKSYHSPKQIASIQNVVASTYKVNHLHVTIVWSTMLLSGTGFWLSIYKPGSRPGSPLRMSGEKGENSFGACGSTVQVFWDLSSAKFGGPGPGPEPVASFYVAVLIDSHPCLLLGDMRKAVTAAALVPTVKPSLVSRCQHLSGTTRFVTRAKFCDPGPAHEVAIRCDADDTLSVTIDERRVVNVARLRWNFRGNQVVFVDGLTVDVMWDLRRWMREDRGRLTASDGGYNGVFTFRTRSGFNSRLWLDHNNDQVEFSFVVCVTRNIV